jgi:chitodextrinase
VDITSLIFAKKYTDNKVTELETQIGEGTILTFSSLSSLQTAYPNGLNVPVWITSENSWYYWDGGISGDTTPPNNVTNLQASNIASTSLTLTWIASTSSDVASYEVYIGTNLLGTVTGTSYNVTGLTASTSYQFTVKAKDSNGNVASGTTVVQVTNASSTDTTPPIVTANPSGGNYSSTQVVTLTVNETATIYYTLDGSTPTTTSGVYSSSISISETKTLKYFAKDISGNSSSVQTQTYTIETGAVPGTVLISDSFNRVDSTSPGNPETGSAWIDFSSANGTVTHGIRNNRLYLSGGTYTATSGRFRRQVTQTVHTSNFTLETKIIIPASVSAILAIGIRIVNDGDILYVEANASGGAIPRYKINKLPSGGSVTTLASGTKVPTNGDVVKIKHYSDGKIEIYVNDVLDITVTDTYLLASTIKVGLGMDNDTLEFDDFKVTMM